MRKSKRHPADFDAVPRQTALKGPASPPLLAGLTALFYAIPRLSVLTTSHIPTEPFLARYGVRNSVSNFMTRILSIVDQPVGPDRSGIRPPAGQPGRRWGIRKGNLARPKRAAEGV